MRIVKGLLVLALLVGGFTAGWLTQQKPEPKGPLDDAREALAELVEYRAFGAHAARHAMDLAYRIAPGGEEIAPAVADAIKTAEPWFYDQDVYSIDVRNGAVSQYRDRHVALLEIAHRIGGETSLAAMMDAAENTAQPYDRIVATMFVAQRSDQPEVRDFLAARLLRLIREERDDKELTWTLRAARGRLNQDVFHPLAAALSAPWLRNAADDVAHGLVVLNRDRAARLFLDILGSATAPRRPRTTCATALGHLLDKQHEAAAILAKDGDPLLLAEFLKSMKGGRYDEVEIHKQTLLSRDPTVRRKYNEERVAHIEAQLALIDELVATIGPERAKQVELPLIREQFREALESGRQAVELAKKMENR